MIGNIDESSVSGMKALKFNENHPHLAFMALHVFYDHGNAISSENDLVAILDTGCNMSCHGSRWLERYTRATNQPMTMPPLDDLRLQACGASTAAWPPEGHDI